MQEEYNCYSGIPSSQSTQQAKKITGKVVDSKSEPIIGASILEKGTSNGTITDINGNFSLNAPQGSTLVRWRTNQSTLSINVINSLSGGIPTNNNFQKAIKVLHSQRVIIEENGLNA